MRPSFPHKIDRGGTATPGDRGSELRQLGSQLLVILSDPPLDTARNEVEPELRRIDENALGVASEGAIEIVQVVSQVGHLLLGSAAKVVQPIAGAAGNFFRDREFGEFGRLYGRTAGRDGGDHLTVVFLQVDVLCANRLCLGYKGLLLNG